MKLRGKVHFLCPQRHTASPSVPIPLRGDLVIISRPDATVSPGVPLLWCVFCGLAQMYKAVSSPLWVMQSGLHCLESPRAWPAPPSLLLAPGHRAGLYRCTASPLGMPAQHTACRFYRVLLSLSDVPLSKSLVFPWHASSFSF